MLTLFEFTNADHSFRALFKKKVQKSKANLYPAVKPSVGVGTMLVGDAGISETTAPVVTTAAAVVVADAAGFVVVVNGVLDAVERTVVPVTEGWTN